jgi:hypothetical protein
MPVVRPRRMAGAGLQGEQSRAITIDYNFGLHCGQAYLNFQTALPAPRREPLLL